MLKKLGSLLLVLVLLVTLAACAGIPGGGASADPTTLAFERYSHILEQMSVGPGESGAYDVDFSMVMDMRFLGEVVHTVSSGNMKMLVDGDNVQTSMVMDMDMGELGTAVMELYMAMEGDTITEMFMSVDGTEIPSEFVDPDMLEDMFGDAVNMPQVNMDAFLSVEIEEVDGNTLMHVVLDGQMLADFALAATGDMLVELGFDMDVEIEDVFMTIVSDSDGNPLSMTMDMNMQMSFEGEGFEELDGEVMTIEMTSEFIFNGFGNSVQMVAFV